MFRRASAVVRWLLLLAVLPLTVILYSSNAATAATYGPAVPFSFTESGGGIAGSGGEIRCNGKAAYKINDSVTMNINASLRCVVDIPMSKDPEVLTGSTSIQLMGASNDGHVEGCDSGAASEANPIAGVSWDVSGFTVDCEVDQICVGWNWLHDVTMGPDISYQGEWCDDLPMGPPPLPSSEGCPLGAPTQVKWETKDGTGWYEGFEGRTVTMKFALGEDFTLWKHWQFHTVYAAGGVGDVPDVSGGGVYKNGATSGPSTNGGTWMGNTFETEPDVGDSGNLYSHRYDSPIGTWIWAVKDPDGPTDLPPGMRAHNTYTYGDNDPMGCHFYFGAKFRDDPNSTLDEPQGAHDSDDEVNPGGDDTPTDITPEPPAPSAPDCEFDIADPTTWASAGICALVGLIARLIDLVGGIASAILNGLKTLFIPRDGFLDGEIRDMKAAWKDTSPGNYLDAFTGITPGSSSGCSGLPLNVDLGGGVVIDEDLGAACSGNMAGVAALVRLALSAVICFAGAIACVRFVASGFGWAPAIGRVDG